MDKVKIRTDILPTWCPGCFNFQIMAGVQRYLENAIKNGAKKEDFAIVSGIGCHAKIFDYLDMPGINTLHGRVPPMAIGIKMARPNLKVIGFSGDGDAYAEGMEHLIHAARFNPDFKYFIHNNQVFALTLAQPTPVTEYKYADKTTPYGVQTPPINPIKLMLESGASFVARVYADVAQVQDIVTLAMAHKGFAFIEIIQPCLIFHPDKGYKERTYQLASENHDASNFQSALAKAAEFDYVDPSARIALGVFYKKERETFESMKWKKA